jgi:hypothetical protein
MSLRRLIQRYSPRCVIPANQDAACHAPGSPSNMRHSPRRHLSSPPFCKPQKPTKLGRIYSDGINPGSYPSFEATNTSRSFATSLKKDPGQAWFSDVFRSKRISSSYRPSGCTKGIHLHAKDSITQSYTLPPGCQVIPSHLLDLCPDSDIDDAILSPPPITSSQKNIWFYWSTGYSTMHNCTKRNIRSWYRRFSKQGWMIRVVDRAPGSPSNVENFLDTKDAETFPQAFMMGR